jgi:hypothetical protein
MDWPRTRIDFSERDKDALKYSAEAAPSCIIRALTAEKVRLSYKTLSQRR